MDALKRPLRVPPDFASYAEAEGIFQLYERMLQALITAKPEDPLQFMSEYLTRKDDNGTHLLFMIRRLIPEANSIISPQCPE